MTGCGLRRSPLHQPRLLLLQIAGHQARHAWRDWRRVRQVGRVPSARDARCSPCSIMRPRNSLARSRPTVEICMWTPIPCEWFLTLPLWHVDATIGVGFPSHCFGPDTTQTSTTRVLEIRRPSIGLIVRETMVQPVPQSLEMVTSIRSRHDPHPGQLHAWLGSPDRRQQGIQGQAVSIDRLGSQRGPRALSTPMRSAGYEESTGTVC